MLTDQLRAPTFGAGDAARFALARKDDTLDREVVQLVGSHAFRDLFIEVLGWNRAQGKRLLELDGHAFVLNAVAHKRGFQVFHCAADRYTLINRYRLRAIQKQLSATAHEHILIYSSEEPRRQVWQWGLRDVLGHRIHHLEHPFLSTSPPPRFRARLRQLQITFEDEDTLTLVDAIERVRSVLGAEPEFNLFARSPRRAQRSDELARAMHAGGVKEFQDFIEFHRRLIRHFAKRWHRRFQIDEDEAEQLCALGVMKAARLFDLNRGFQFSTYASKSAKREVRRLTAEVRFPIHFPQYVLPFCFATLRLLDQQTVAVGPNLAREAVEQELLGVHIPLVDAWTAFHGVLERQTLSDRSNAAVKAVRRLPAPGTDASAPTIRRELTALVHRLVSQLDDRDRQVVRLYHGFDGEPLTLQAIGDRVGLTRERIRQILNEVYDRLRPQLDMDPEDLRALL